MIDAPLLSKIEVSFLTEQFNNFKNYYLIKCFEKSDYRTDFNNGTNIHLNHAQNYWTQNNTFQHDLEGLIFSQGESEGKIYFCNPSQSEAFHKTIKHASGNFTNIKTKLDNICSKNFKTIDFFLSIPGFLSCFCIIPKNYISFKGDKIIFTSEEYTYYDFIYFCEKYIEDKNAAFITFYDAALFVEKFCNGLTAQKYEFLYDCVKYKEQNKLEKIYALQNKDIQNLIFVKNPDYSYQREFRFWIIGHNDELNRKFIEIQGINFIDSIVFECVYLSKKYATSLGLTN